MTDNQRNRDEGDWGEQHLDPREQAEAEVNLDDPSAGADEPWSPPDRMPRGAEFIGVETDGGETLDQRINQEQPDPGTAYGAPDDHAGREGEPMVGGDDPDAIPADQDVLGSPDDTAEPVAGESPEEEALRVVDDPDR